MPRYALCLSSVSVSVSILIIKKLCTPRTRSDRSTVSQLPLVDPASQVHGECWPWPTRWLRSCCWCCRRRLSILELVIILILDVIVLIAQRGHGLESCPNSRPFASWQNGPRAFSSGHRGTDGSIGTALPLLPCVSPAVHEHRCARMGTHTRARARSVSAPWPQRHRQSGAWAKARRDGVTAHLQQ